ncbi:hypothetical protein NHQ30_002075 [Ciborinia camelliae]|nr:hypothetical protein NHQ30_002075 [Ciborinia camelliae]
MVNKRKRRAFEDEILQLLHTSDEELGAELPAAASGRMLPKRPPQRHPATIFPKAPPLKTLVAGAQSSPSLSTSTIGKAETSNSFLAKHGTQMVDIFVGEEKQLFRFFDKMFNGNFKEATENTAILPEDDPEAFDMLMCWAAYGTIRSLQFEYFRKSLHLWILAEKLCLGSLQDHVMDMWRKNDKLTDKYYTAEEVQYIFQKAPTKSSARQYAARMLRFQSLRSPARDLDYSVDCRGDPIPLSNMNVATLSKFLIKNEDILEDYLDVADRSQVTNVNEMDPRVTPFSCRFHHHPASQFPCPSRRTGKLAFKYIDDET